MSWLRRRDPLPSRDIRLAGARMRGCSSEKALLFERRTGLFQAAGTSCPFTSASRGFGWSSRSSGARRRSAWSSGASLRGISVLDQGRPISFCGHVQESRADWLPRQLHPVVRLVSRHWRVWLPTSDRGSILGAALEPVGRAGVARWPRVPRTPHSRTTQFWLVRAGEDESRRTAGPDLVRKLNKCTAPLADCLPGAHRTR